jgi:hypothetical protein
MKAIKVITAVALLSLSSVAMAQEETDFRDDLRLGIKAGLNYSNVYDSKTEDFEADSKVGFVGGAFLSIPLGKYLGLQPEILFSQKGFKGTGSLLGSEYKFTRTTYYIDLPLQFAFKPSEFITLLAGPQYSYLLSQKDVFSNSIVSYTQEQKFKNEDVRKNIFGFVVGLDVNLKKVILGTRLGWDIRNNHGDGTSNIPRYKNAWFQGTIGFAL